MSKQDIKMMNQVCLNCGMSVSEMMQHCPKCDNDLNAQHDGSTITIDIAHKGERVNEALSKMQCEIALARKEAAKRMRLIVGSGLIREEVMLALRDLEYRDEIKGFKLEPKNAGAVLINLK